MQSSADIPVVILCGGLGTRLGKDTQPRPKALVEIGDRPIIWHVMKIYSRFGFKRFILCLGYQGFQIKQYFLHYRQLVSDFTINTGQADAIDFHGTVDHDWTITFAETGQETQTGGRIKCIEKYISTDFFLATYADGLANIDISQLVSFHKSHHRIATMTAVRPLSSFGILSFDPEGTPVGFQEKPQQNEWINGGFFVFDRRIFNYLDKDCVLEGEPMTRLAADRELAVFNHNGFWRCMDTFKDAWALNEAMKGVDRAPWDEPQAKAQPSGQ